MPAVWKATAVDRLREIVASVLELDLDEVDADALFYEDLGADSLEKVEITTRIETDFGVRLATAESAEVRNVQDAADLLERKGAGEESADLPEGGGAGPEPVGPAPHEGAAGDPVDLLERLVDRHIAAGRGEAVAYIDPDLGEVSYERLREAARGYAGALRAAGVAAGTRGLIVAEDSVATVVAILGLWWAGCVPVPTTPMLTDAEIAFIAEDCSAGFVHVDAGAAKQRSLRTAFGELPVLTGEDVREAARSGRANPAHRPDEAPEAARWAPGVEALLQYTSGSTGRPKGVRHAAPGLINMLESFGRVMGVRPDDRVLSTARMSFGFGFSSSVLCPLDAGACTVLIRGSVDVQVVMAAVQRHRPTVLCSVPRLYAALLDSAEREGTKVFSSLRLCLCAGERCPEALSERIRATVDAELMNCLGATEVMHVVLATPPGQCPPGSVGVAVPGVTVTVRDDRGAVVPDGEDGRLHVAGPTTALGYLDRPEAAVATFADGGVYTGDLVRRTSDGSIEHLCRADDVLNLGGYKVAPGEIESVVRETEGVADCKVVPTTDDDGLEQAVVYAVAEDGSDTAQVRKAVMTAVRRKLAVYKRPSRVEFLDELPVTSSGKVATYKLRKRVVRP